MEYRVDLTNRATRDLATLFLAKNAAGAGAGARWFNQLEEAISSLSRFPRRNPIAPENRKARIQLRHLLWGRRPHVYRVVYRIGEPNKVVNVVTIRHGAMEPADVTEDDG
jgi:plasmid stabilization system protein ParE